MVKIGSDPVITPDPVSLRLIRWVYVPIEKWQIVCSGAVE